MAKKRPFRKLGRLLAKPFVALKEAIRIRWWPTDQERMAKVIPDFETISDLRNSIGIVYSGDICAPRSQSGGFDIKKAKELHGMPIPADMDPYILVRNDNGHHVKVKSTDCLKREIKSRKQVWGSDDELKVLECHDPKLPFTPDKDDPNWHCKTHKPPSEPYPDGE